MSAPARPGSEPGLASLQAMQTAQRLRAEGVNMVDFHTTPQNLSPAINELDAAMRSGRLAHDGNPVLGWCVGNVVGQEDRDRKSTRLNSSHANISYAVFCLKKKNTHQVLVKVL